jgi:cytochrome c5
MPLPGMPELPAPQHRQPPPDIRVARIATGRLCERCCQMIHDYGQAGAPYPRGARWRVSTAESMERLCDAHKEERLDQ